MNDRKKRSQPALLMDFNLKTHQGQRMCQWMDYRLKNLLFMLEVVYSENQSLHDLSTNAIKEISQEFESLDQNLQHFLDAMPQPNNNKASIRYNKPKNFTIQCTTPQVITYVNILKNYDLLIQKCDRLWLTQQWGRMESRKPIHEWGQIISKSISFCSELFAPLRSQYIQYRKLQHSDDEENKPNDQEQS
ncbi:hypothetical protein [Endozoicomonas numazuensis]|uniref:Uncharacterized protein n=1 Tax=Endozoicomonas numazuensis TaxID=1137799 RepID=A0A081NHE3_9GAMM|nr:hypothetical protein [Endozoicomonas numazuensis]KEQ17866.1 hypothetical protein GZ78_09460 [Endozoicomonas numazuensis]